MVGHVINSEIQSQQARFPVVLGPLNPAMDKSFIDKTSDSVSSEETCLPGNNSASEVNTKIESCY